MHQPLLHQPLPHRPLLHQPSLDRASFDKPLRIAMLSLHTSPLAQPGGGDAGGLNVYVRALSLELASAGMEVDIFTRTTGVGGQTTIDEPARGMRVHHIPAGPAGKVPKEALPRLVDELAAGISASSTSTGPFDLVHSHYWVSGLAGLLLAADWKVPLVHTMHTMARVKNQHTMPGQPVEPGRREEGEERIVHHANLLIANTAAEAEELHRHYGADPARIDVVVPGADLRVFRPAFRARSRSHVGIPPGNFHVVFAGRLQRLKGPHVLIQAAAALKRSRPDLPLRLSVIGSSSGADKYDLMQLAKELDVADRVAFYPPVNASELAHWYRAADVVAMPSASESFGLVALEAQACGTPVLATDVGGLPYAVSDGRTGLLVKGRHTKDWARALEALWDDPQTRLDLGRAASVHAEGFSWQRTAALTLETYRRALADAVVGG
ncbi:MAG: mshA [Micrococcaceae bacterium]|nr:mshA [Micrococcaceae bacterium]